MIDKKLFYKKVVFGPEGRKAIVISIAKAFLSLLLYLSIIYAARYYSNRSPVFIWPPFIAGIIITPLFWLSMFFKTLKPYYTEYENHMKEISTEQQHPLDPDSLRDLGK